MPAALLAAFLVTAQAAPCPDAQTTVDVQACYSAAAAQADADLATLVGRIRSAMAREPEILTRLETSQVAWRAERRATCGELVDRLWTGGSIRNVQVAACELELTRQRIEALQHVFHAPLNN
jgi:uncharacterized protein YecT (DUF1311 family)